MPVLFHLKKITMIKCRKIIIPFDPLLTFKFFLMLLLFTGIKKEVNNQSKIFINDCLSVNIKLF